MSPTLFNLYLSDLPEKLNQKNFSDIESDSQPLTSMLYADDLVIFSKSPESMQSYLDCLSDYCDRAELTVNLDKTKIMIFNNNGKVLYNHNFYYRRRKLEIVKSYKYLGFIVSHDISWTNHVRSVVVLCSKLCIFIRRVVNSRNLVILKKKNHIQSLESVQRHFSRFCL